MHDVLGNLIEYDDHGGPGNPSHITVGYCDNRSIDLTGLGRDVQLPSGSGSLVRLSVAASRGTCRAVIGMFSLGAVTS
jgi:hypothetical protein